MSGFDDVAVPKLCAGCKQPSGIFYEVKGKDYCPKCAKRVKA